MNNLSRRDFLRSSILLGLSTIAQPFSLVNSSNRVQLLRNWVDLGYQQFYSPLKNMQNIMSLPIETVDTFQLDELVFVARKSYVNSLNDVLEVEKNLRGLTTAEFDTHFEAILHYCDEIPDNLYKARQILEQKLGKTNTELFSDIEKYRTQLEQYGEEARILCEKFGIQWETDCFEDMDELKKRIRERVELERLPSMSAMHKYLSAQVPSNFSIPKYNRTRNW